MALREEQRQAIRQRVHEIPLVDGHAHNLVHLQSSFPFSKAFSEAEGDALSQSIHTLCFRRSIRDVATLYGCEPSLKSIEEYRKAQGIENLCSVCFDASNIGLVLMDDGLALDKMLHLQDHPKRFPKVQRVLRIERLAEDILNEGPPGGVTWTLESFADRFISALTSLSKEVVAFKSIAAYRSGLNINPNVSSQATEEGLFQNVQGGFPIRIRNKSLIDFIFTSSLEVATSQGIPMQIHTGFGDNDLDLKLANPLHLRLVLEDKRFLTSRLVLLHASYPFMKEASYLASVFPQVYLDFGLAVPKLSVSGMQATLNEILELAPLNKIMFSTDGYAFPETYYLGVKWTREILSRVLCDACDNGDLLVDEALQAADDILRWNALNFYKISEEKHSLLFQAIEEKRSSSICQGKASEDGRIVKNVRLLWADASGQRRCRVVPKRRFETLIVREGVGVAQCIMAMSSHTDAPAEGSVLTAVGEFRLIPHMPTLTRIPWFMDDEMVLGNMHLNPGTVWEYCPRSTLQRVSDILLNEFGLVMNAGFETEFYILKRNQGDNEWVGLDSTPYCSSAAFDGVASILAEIMSALSSMGIGVEQLHAEAGGGQFELALEYSPCMKAADNVLFLRECIKAVVGQNSMQIATFLPKYFLNDVGSGSHVHLSLWEGNKNIFMAEAGGSTNEYGISKRGQEFMAGVLHHLPAILAFTCPLPNSYDRLVPNTWSGAFQCWGNENREAPLRTACPPGTHTEFVSNFEVKSFDGCANPHLGLAAIMAAGIEGLRKHLDLPPPIDVNPALLEGKVKRLPATLDEAVSALQKDEALKNILGEKLVDLIITIRQAEIKYYANGNNSLDKLVQRY